MRDGIGSDLFPPDITGAVAAGFDLAWKQLNRMGSRPSPLADEPRTRYVLAKIVLSAASEGLHDPARLAQHSLNDLTTTLPRDMRRAVLASRSE
jgi:hypothetical protein